MSKIHSFQYVFKVAQSIPIIYKGVVINPITLTQFLYISKSNLAERKGFEPSIRF